MSNQAPQFDINKFNSFLDAASKTIACDPECQKKKEAENLKNKYLNSKSNLILAEPEYEVSKKNYYTYISGQGGYHDMMEDEFNKKANAIVNQFKKLIEDESKKIDSQLETYGGILSNYNNVEDLESQYKEENAKLLKQLKTDTNDVYTSERKTYYEDQQIGRLKTIYIYVFVVIYSIIVILFVIFNFTYPSGFSLRNRFGIFISLIILPFISTWLLGRFIQFIHWIYNKMPKNVYKGVYV
jgi:hypothetical protein